MKPNVGEKERYVRVVLGCLAAVSAVTISKSRRLSALLGAIAASGIETGLSRYCPANEILGIDNAPNLTETPISSIFQSRAIRAVTANERAA